MSAKDGGPAFPRALPKGEFTPEDVLRIIEQHAGMTLRDYFAAKVLPWCLREWANGFETVEAEAVAAEAYEIADAMLKARAG